MYPLAGYAMMIADPSRPFYEEALRAVITPDTVVADLGCGTGHLSLMACKLGARKVYAMDPVEWIYLGEKLAVANGCSERIEFFQAFSTAVNLPERVDVIVSDIHDLLPTFGKSIVSFCDARARFLKPGGAMIPQRETLWAAPVEAERAYKERLAAWELKPLGINMELARGLAANGYWKWRMQPDQLLAAPQCWGELDYLNVEDPNVAGNLSWKAGRPGTLHGLSLWFDAQLFGDIGFSNAPGELDAMYSNAFYPLEHPVEVEAGDEIQAALGARLVGSNYVWSWNTTVVDRSGRRKAQYRQSTFYGELIPPDTLRKQAADYTPALNEEGEIDLRILSWMSGSRRTLQEIAGLLAEQFPRRFPSESSALDRVAELSVRCSS